MCNLQISRDRLEEVKVPPLQIVVVVLGLVVLEHVASSKNMLKQAAAAINNKSSKKYNKSNKLNKTINQSNVSQYIMLVLTPIKQHRNKL